MNSKQEERLVAAWEGIAQKLGDLNETFRTAISKQWPDPRQPREAIISRIPTAEDKLRVATGNTEGPVEQWLSEFPDETEEEIGTREREWLEKHSGAGQKQSTSRTKTAS